MQDIPRRDFQFFTYANNASPTSPSPPPPLPPLTLKNSSSWTYCGPLLPLTNNESDLPVTFRKWSAHTLSTSLLPRLMPFLAAAHDFLRTQGLHHYWLTIRASRPTSEFDEPRWHTDDHFFNPAQSDTASGLWKLCTTLLGPGTLFAADGHRARRCLRGIKDTAKKRQGQHLCLAIRCAACGKTSDEIRAEMARVVRETRMVVAQPAAGEAVFFRVGGMEGAVHSEPKIDCDRVFVNLVPGTEEDLEGLMGRWGLEFPRSWSFGVPLMFGVGEPDDTLPQQVEVETKGEDPSAQPFPLH